MLVGGGRILVAAVGAVVLAFVAVFIVRAVWWNPTSSQSPITSAPATTDTATSGPETTGAQKNPEANPDASAGESRSDGNSTDENSTHKDSTSNGTTNQTTEPYTATSERIKRIVGTVAVDVKVPQVEGGNPDVATVFNDEMQRALLAQADSLTAGKLEDGPDSGVRIGERVLSGLLWTESTSFLTAESVALASTVVVDANSGSLITLASLFKDLDKGLMRLQEEAQQLGPSANDSFDGSRLEPSEKIFERWTAETEGMRLYFDQGLVAPEAEGIIDLTIPWDKLNDVLKPGVAQIVAS
jgi:hypothetical protein